ncbi:DUF3467 domain-containing protein [Frigoriglobus tundricola]|uniref:Diguanylate cyclase/phosphodiesterase (GGDEF & EAL domains) with PAS/PAC sensor(S) n=1 Tax=Frigoriglobus tundricola TaxID=2774151 RepID=A0A6M5YJA2_9BACT|nr:DUF3467 domain-containing protein [Frigoriglobus tundricola]QJW93421.1 diguanylate cyclase/phosphodiesterase (GGDEF & EAL domains) with PAS/PAC sensor(s) [Frigoriglobus tundricola]
MDESKIPIQPQTATGVQPGQQVQIPVDASNRETVYVNFFQAHMSNDELFLDLAAFPGLVGTTPEAIALTHRLVMNFYTAKRLGELLRAAVARHEQVFGALELDVNRRMRTPPQRPAGT